MTFDGVAPGIIPISPTLLKFNVEVDRQKVKIERRQIAIVPGYAFTDYKSQGQTLEYVIVDIAKPPSGSLSPFSVYVTLSRSRGRKMIRILREFDPGLFMHHPSEDLRREMTRLEELDRSREMVIAIDRNLGLTWFTCDVREKVESSEKEFQLKPLADVLKGVLAIKSHSQPWITNRLLQKQEWGEGEPELGGINARIAYVIAWSTGAFASYAFESWLVGWWYCGCLDHSVQHSFMMTQQ
ncbi:hypothetical protein BYT27DRAFT_7218459 [Phlegmacium glaucopus]|nr:hypothetical protein BYT27DRAFT_7218459 [Phlegmacium glaucopus]